MAKPTLIWLSLEGCMSPAARLHCTHLPRTLPCSWLLTSPTLATSQRPVYHCSRSQVVAYGISINLVEVTWKSKIKAQFPNPNDYSLFMGNFSTATGAVTFLMMLLSRVIFRKFGWGTAALITPTVLLITGAPPMPIVATLFLLGSLFASTHGIFLSLCFCLTDVPSVVLGSGLPGY